jgi:hypothetical protein
MANVSDNLLVRGARGNVGKQFVYRHHGNDTHIVRMPRVDKNAVATEKQEKTRDLFGSASLYAQGAMSSPELKKEYQKKSRPGMSAQNIALRDYLKAPVVKSIYTGEYTGAPGSTIIVSAKDNFKVARVKVSIHTATGALVEEGDATLNPLDRNKWVYTATQSNALLANSVISATAWDLPGNTGNLEISV